MAENTTPMPEEESGNFAREQNFIKTVFFLSVLSLLLWVLSVGAVLFFHFWDKNHWIVFFSGLYIKALVNLQFLCPLLMLDNWSFTQFLFAIVVEKKEVESLIQFIRRRNRLHVWFLSLTERLSDPSYFLPFSLYRGPCCNTISTYNNIFGCLLVSSWEIIWI